MYRVAGGEVGGEWDEDYIIMSELGRIIYGQCSVANTTPLKNNRINRCGERQFSMSSS